jgi:hypothetical protein
MFTGGGKMVIQFKLRRWWCGLWLLLVLGWILTTGRSVQAHTRIEVGPYAIVMGWAEEPAIIGERNALVIEVTEDEVPVTGVEATLNVEVQYAGRTFSANLNPTPDPGWYSVEIFPTVRGQYAVHLSGSIGDVAVDEVVEPEEVFSAARIQFPEAQPDPRELQAEIDKLTNQLESARTLAYVGIGSGVLGLILAAVSLVRRRQ